MIPIVYVMSRLWHFLKFYEARTELQRYFGPT